MKVVLTKPAEKDLVKLEREILRRIVASLEKLTSTPSTMDIKKLQGFEDRWRLRVGSYRVIFKLDQTEEIIYVLSIRHRREAY